MILSSTAGILILFALVTGALVTILGYWMIQFRSFSFNMIIFIASIIITYFVKKKLSVDIIEYTTREEVDRYFSIGFGSFHASDGREVDIHNIADSTLYVNSSETDLLIIPVFYGNGGPKEDPEYIPPHTAEVYPEEVEYTPALAPQKEIFTLGSFNEHFYWLTTVKQYNEMFPDR